MERMERGRMRMRMRMRGEERRDWRLEREKERGRR
jgi:hypothetical protein